MLINRAGNSPKQEREKRRHWSQLFRNASNGKDPSFQEEQRNLVAKERSDSQMYFLIGLVLSILVVQSAFRWKPSETAHTPLPQPDEVTIELVEMMDPVKVIEEDPTRPP
jgi:hypothetical protein